MQLNYEIRKMKNEDKKEVLLMMDAFYSSAAVYSNGSQEIFNTDIDNCISDNPYLDGFIFADVKLILGYAMIAKSFSTEYGKPCVWLEDLYIKPEYRGNGIIPKFISYIREKYPDAVFKLEVECGNTHALHVYKKAGFEGLPYKEMIKL